MTCNKCNNIIPDDVDFCPYCGNKIEYERNENKEQAENIETIDTNAQAQLSDNKESTAETEKTVEFTGNIESKNQSEQQVDIEAETVFSKAESDTKNETKNENAKKQRRNKIIIISSIIVALIVLICTVIFANVILKSKNEKSKDNIDTDYTVSSEIDKEGTNKEIVDKAFDKITNLTDNYSIQLNLASSFWLSQSDELFSGHANIDGLIDFKDEKSHISNGAFSASYQILGALGEEIENESQSYNFEIYTGNNTWRSQDNGNYKKIDGKPLKANDFIWFYSDILKDIKNSDYANVSDGEDEITIQGSLSNAEPVCETYVAIIKLTKDSAYDKQTNSLPYTLKISKSKKEITEITFDMSEIAAYIWINMDYKASNNNFIITYNQFGGANDIKMPVDDSEKSTSEKFADVTSIKCAEDLIGITQEEYFDMVDNNYVQGDDDYILIGTPSVPGISGTEKLKDYVFSFNEDMTANYDSPYGEDYTVAQYIAVRGKGIIGNDLNGNPITMGRTYNDLLTSINCLGCITSTNLCYANINGKKWLLQFKVTDEMTNYAMQLEEKIQASPASFDGSRFNPVLERATYTGENFDGITSDENLSTATINANQVMIRNVPYDTDFSKMWTVNKGDKVFTFGSSDDDFTYVYYETKQGIKFGYVPTKYIDF